MNPYNRANITPTSQTKPSIPAKFEQKIKDLNTMKTSANKFVTSQEYEQAADAYYKILNSISAESDAEFGKCARDIETACRLNLALCKLKLDDF